MMLLAATAAIPWLCLPGRAGAERATPTIELPPLPDKLPPGYVMEAKHRVRWIYPSSATDEVADLQAKQLPIWRRLARELGQEIADDLDIRVARDPAEMRRLVGGQPLPSYATGVAFPKQGLILLSLTAPKSWLRPNMEHLLTHELSHVALHRAVSGTDIPRWFSEGVAIHQAGERSLARIRTLWTGTLSKQLVAVERLSSTFPRNHHEVALAYAQSADLVRYLLDGRAERRRFRALITNLRAGTTFDDAVSQAYHVSLGYIEREWRGEITRRYGRWPSLLAGLTGMWAIGALLLVLGYFRTRRRHHQTLRRWETEEAEADARRLLQVPPVPPAEERGQPKPNPGGRVDEVFDRLRDGRSKPGVPTVEHDGRNHTLH